MHVHLNNPELQKFVDEQVRAGHFPSRNAVVEAAIAQMKIDCAALGLTDEDLNAIADSDTQIDRGEYVEFDEFAAKMRKRYCKE